MAALAAVAVGFGHCAAQAQTVPELGSITDDALAVLAPKSHHLDNPLLKPSRDYRGIALGDWLFYPAVIAGAVYDDNLVASASKPMASGGFKLGTQALLQRDTGMHKTSAYGEADANLFPSESKANAFNGRIGLGHIWEVQRDFTVTARAEYTHRTAPISGGMLWTPSGLVPLISPQTYDRFSGLIALKKSFGNLFVGVAAETTRTTYSPLDTAAGKVQQGYRDNWVNSVSVRGGVWFSPVMYAFTEATGNHHAYDDGAFASKGYRVTAGIGSDRISLFRGEMFGGYQRQYYDNAAVGSSGSPVLGGRLFWFPTRALTFRAMVDQTFVDSNLPTAGNPYGHPSRVITSELRIDYKMAREWSASVQGGFAHSSYINSARRDEAWRIGASVNYDVTRNLGVTLAYDFNRVNSNEVGSSYSRNLLNFNVKYRY